MVLILTMQLVFDGTNIDHAVSIYGIEGWGKMGYGGKWDAFIFFYLMACQRQTIS